MAMVVVDTNVLSEPTKLLPSPAVLDWLRSRSPHEVYTTAISQAEILYGIESLPTATRRAALAAATEALFAEDYAGRILPFDADAARFYARIVADRRATGRPISQPDAMIAAIARAHGAALATRDIEDFDGCGIRVVNPWGS
jgi:predicted nucleic acid-binding protein